MPDRFIVAMTEQTKALDRLANAFEKSHRTGRRLMGLQVTLIILAAVIVWGIFSIRSTQSDAHHALSIVEQATSPQAEQKNNRIIQELIQNSNDRAACSDNHLDRVLAVVLHEPVPPRPTYCASDTLPKPPSTGG